MSSWYQDRAIWDLLHYPVPKLSSMTENEAIDIIIKMPIDNWLTAIAVRADGNTALKILKKKNISDDQMYNCLDRLLSPPWARIRYAPYHLLVQEFTAQILIGMGWSGGEKVENVIPWFHPIPMTTIIVQCPAENHFFHRSVGVEIGERVTAEIFPNWLDSMPYHSGKIGDLTQLVDEDGPIPILSRIINRVTANKPKFWRRSIGESPVSLVEEGVFIGAHWLIGYLASCQWSMLSGVDFLRIEASLSRYMGMEAWRDGDHTGWLIRGDVAIEFVTAYDGIAHHTQRTHG